MSTEYIDRQGALEEMARTAPGSESHPLFGVIENYPAADVQERRYAVWKRCTVGDKTTGAYVCSNCGWSLWWWTVPEPFCPNCGSVMENEEVKDE